MNKLVSAFLYACMAHSEQRRKYTDEPYVNHCASVAFLVSSVTDDEDMIIAALLHDVIEDTKFTALDIKDLFGGRVAELVVELTNVSKLTDGNRAQRKQMDRERLAKVSKEAKTIKLADLIDNARSIVKYDHKFSMTFMPEKEALLEVLADGDPLLYNKALGIIEGWKRDL